MFWWEWFKAVPIFFIYKTKNKKAMIELLLSKDPSNIKLFCILYSTMQKEEQIAIIDKLIKSKRFFGNGEDDITKNFYHSVFARIEADTTIDLMLTNNANKQTYPALFAYTKNYYATKDDEIASQLYHSALDEFENYSPSYILNVAKITDKINKRDTNIIYCTFDYNMRIKSYADLVLHIANIFKSISQSIIKCKN